MNHSLKNFPFLWEYKEIKKYADNLTSKEDKIKFYRELLGKITAFGKEKEEKLIKIEKFIKDNRLENFFKIEKIKDILNENKEISGYFDFLRIIIKNSQLIRYELNNTRTKIENYVKVETLLNENTFLKYKDELKHGYFEDNFKRDVESIEKIEDKIIFLNYIIRMIDEEIEEVDLSLKITTRKIEKYDKQIYKETLQELYNKQSSYEEEIDLYEMSKGYMFDYISFWNEQLDIRSGKKHSNKQTESFDIDSIFEDNEENKKINGIESKENGFRNEWQFYNYFNFDIIMIDNHF